MADIAKVRQDKKGYYIFLQWQRERHFISTYMGLVSFRDNELLAKKAKDAIDSEIDRGIFRPERWKTRAKKLYNVQGYSENWLKKIEPELSTATHFDYYNSFKNHINPVVGHEYIEDVNLDKLQDLMNRIDRIPKGKKNVIGALHRMLKYAHRAGHINQMPLFPEFRGTNKIIKPEIVYIEPAESLKILEKIHIRHRPIFTFGTLTGCRPSEARALRKQDMKVNQITFAVTFGRHEELKEVKGKKIMPFPMTEALIELFHTMPKNLTHWVFMNPETGNHYGRNINRIYNRARKKAGITERLTLHKFFRHSFAMNLLNQGVAKEIVSRLLRHQDLRTIDNYGDYKTDPLKSVLDNIQSLNLQPICNSEAANQ
ncbi:MAG: tyrosine-type recombinase/integrase [Desulfobacteraceae bacterium]|nr:tyrosine-type recombinase/integrase [Desulfobacteraceae bacterium]